jgi:hypothetical protein
VVITGTDVVPVKPGKTTCDIWLGRVVGV